MQRGRGCGRAIRQQGAMPSRPGTSLELPGGQWKATEWLRTRWLEMEGTLESNSSDTPLNPNCTHEETEAQRRKGIHPRSPRMSRTGVRLEPGFPTPQWMGRGERA